MLTLILVIVVTEAKTQGIKEAAARINIAATLPKHWE